MRTSITFCSTGGITRAGVVGAFICLAALAVTSAQAGIIVQDDFNGPVGTPDTTKWSAPGDYSAANGTTGWREGTLDGAGMVNVSQIDITPTFVAAKPSFESAPSASVALRLTMSVSGATTNFSFGLSDWDTHVIELREDAALGGTAGNWKIFMSSNWATTYEMYDTGKTDTSGTWEFNWTPTHVTLLLNNVLVFDSAVNGPTTDIGAPGWQIPTAGLAPMAYTYGGTGAGSVDSVVFESIALPEPSTALSLGAIVLLARRRWQRPRSQS
jgi:hypothetical protein